MEYTGQRQAYLDLKGLKKKVTSYKIITTLVIALGGEIENGFIYLFLFPSSYNKHR